MPKTLKICLYVFCGIALSLIFFSQAQAANVTFIADTQLNISGAPTTLYINTGSECDSLDVSTSTLTADIPAGSTFTLKTATYTVLALTPTGGTVTLDFNTNYFSTGYISQWTASSTVTAATVVFTVRAPLLNTSYLLKVDGSGTDYYVSNSTGLISFNYTSGFSDRIFQIKQMEPPFSGIISTGGGTTPSVEEETIDEEVVDDGEQEEEEEEEEEIKPISEMTSTELEAEINRIAALIAQLQTQLAGLLGEAVYEGIPTDFSFEESFKYGQTSDDVKYLQIILKAEIGEPTYPENVSATGWFGPITRDSVIEFQEKYTTEILTPWKITEGTGLVGSTTRDKLNSLLGR